MGLDCLRVLWVVTCTPFLFMWCTLENLTNHVFFVDDVFFKQGIKEEDGMSRITLYHLFVVGFFVSWSVLVILFSESVSTSSSNSLRLSICFLKKNVTTTKIYKYEAVKVKLSLFNVAYHDVSKIIWIKLFHDHCCIFINHVLCGGLSVCGCSKPYKLCDQQQK